MASCLHHTPSRIHIWNRDNLFIDQQSQGPSLGHHKPRQDSASGNPAILQNVKAITKLLGSRGSSMLAWGKDHVPPKRMLSEEQCELSYINDNLPFNNPESWDATSRQLPESLTYENKIEHPSNRIHLSRSNDCLKACSCSSPEQGPLCVAPSVVTTITSGDVDFAAQKTSLPSRIMEWASGLEKQATNMLQGPYTLYVGTFTTSPDSNTSSSDVHLIGDAGVDHIATTSTPRETGMTIEYSSTMMTEVELVPAATEKTISRSPTVFQPSDNDPISRHPMMCLTEQGDRYRIHVLEAKRDALVRRKTSIEKAIYDLIWKPRPCPPYDAIAREEVKKTTARLNSELADIRKEEHDVGLSLYRALKSHDESSGGSGSTSLWVSRVTR
ncbi:uncharacterized protein BDW70DRAFT_154340 [Aspergillus foveolatus]|uniref:uncharacterized protein n=1 Tax=Aspergillus foveolatus TaxID=210207 RepID=UPI003CCCE33A